MRKSRLAEFVRSPERSLILVSLPIIASSFVETIYTLTDAIFVGRLGAEALAAITFAWPFFFVLTAISLGLNIGIGSRISRFLGERNKKQAENTMMHGLLICVALALAIAAACLPFLKTIFSITGAKGNVMVMLLGYMSIILLGTVFMFVSYAISSIFAAQGDTKTAMKIDIYSLALNIILAPTFIFLFRMGVNGSALAIITSNLLALIIAIYYLRKVSYLKFHIKSFRFSMPIIKDIVGVGFPSMLMMLIVSVYMVFLNRAMMNFSVDHVAMFGIVTRLESVSTLPIYGLSVGAMTLAGMFYGAKKYDLLKRVSWYAIKISFLVSAVVGIIILALPGLLLKLFTSDMSVISIGIPYLRLDVLTLPLMAATMMISRIMQGIGRGVPGLVISVIRALVLAVPLAYVFVFVLGYGYLSIITAGIIGGVIATAIGLIWLKKEISKEINAG